MCGIAGFIPQTPLQVDHLNAIGKDMSACLHHRGPDRAAQWVDENASIVLAHTRLSIQDLSDAGNQPMVSNNGRYAIVFNGEIYNFRNLKKGISTPLKGHSDTEILLALIEEFGLEKTLPKLNGMFAFALFDTKENTLHFARDPLGKKPLYMGWAENGFYFASEMKAIQRACPAPLTIDQRALNTFLRWRYVPDPHCIFDGFYKLPPAHTLSVKLDELRTPFDITARFKEFWSFESCINQRAQNISDSQAISAFEDTLTNAVKRRMIADVPLGAFLSGGIDSTLIATLMAKHNNAPIKTFTIGFDDPRYNESAIAKRTAETIGSDHTQITLTAEDALNSVEMIARLFDEPFADPSAIPTYHVCKLAHQHMTVALSGDGGDESFGGYSWYARAQKIAPFLNCPYALRKPLATLAKALPNAQIQKIAAMLDVKTNDDLYPALLTYWDALIGDNDKQYETPFDDLKNTSWDKSLTERLMSFDTKMFLAGDVLTKVDRCSMAHGLEVRSPLLDKDVITAAWALPLKIKVRNGHSKWILRELLKKHLPDYDLDQPKRGFSIPHGQWLKTDLRDWAEDLLTDPQNINPDLITPFWEKHKTGRADYGHYLWTHVMLQSWLRENGGAA